MPKEEKDSDRSPLKGVVDVDVCMSGVVSVLTASQLTMHEFVKKLLHAMHDKIIVFNRNLVVTPAPTGGLRWGFRVSGFRVSGFMV